MSEKKSYGEMLRDPRWQRRRLEVLKRDNFSCQGCGSDELELHVHHRKYLRGAPPWESQDDHLLTLCEPCHERATQERRRLLNLIDELDPFCLAPLIGYALALYSEDDSEHLEHERMDWGVAQGFAGGPSGL